jgi:hypothetical protein
VAFDFAVCYASSLFPEKPERCKAQDVLDIPYTESDTSFLSLPLSDVSPESSCEITTITSHQPRVSAVVSILPLRRAKAKPCLPPLTVEPHLPMPDVLAENGVESPNSPSKERQAPRSSHHPFRPRRKPGPAPIQTVRVDYNVLEDDDEPIVDFDLFTLPTLSPLCDTPPPQNPRSHLNSHSNPPHIHLPCNVVSTTSQRSSQMTRCNRSLRQSSLSRSPFLLFQTVTL